MDGYEGKRYKGDWENKKENIYLRERNVEERRNWGIKRKWGNGKDKG